MYTIIWAQERIDFPIFYLIGLLHQRATWHILRSTRVQWHHAARHYFSRSRCRSNEEKTELGKTLFGKISFCGVLKLKFSVHDWFVFWMLAADVCSLKSYQRWRSALERSWWLEVMKLHMFDIIRLCSRSNLSYLRDKRIFRIRISEQWRYREENFANSQCRTPLIF